MGDGVGSGPGAPWPEEQSLRSWLALLEARGELGVVRSPIDPDREVAAVLERCDGRRAVRFDAVRGSAFPLVGNALLGREHLALAMGRPLREVAEAFAAAVERPRPCRPVAPEEAPCLARSLDGDRLLSLLPLTVQHEHDAGRYLTSALVAVRDPLGSDPLGDDPSRPRPPGRRSDPSITNLSINRMLAVGERELRVLVLPGRLRRILEHAEREGRDLEVAVLLGVDPLLEMASQTQSDHSVDDLEVASALRAGALTVTRSPLLGLTVPAEVEMVLEGRFRAGRREPEGPFGEFPLTYGPGGPAPVLELVACWHRPGATFQAILSGGREHFLVGGVPREAALLRALRRAHLDVAGVCLPVSGSCRFHAVVALRRPAPGVAVNALLTVFAANPTIKSAVIVDEDVDPFDDHQVGWAVATRVQADRDVLVVPGARGSSLDPSAHEGITARLGIDATAPAGERERFARMRVAPGDPAAVERYLAELGLPGSPGESP